MTLVLNQVFSWFFYPNGHCNRPLCPEELWQTLGFVRAASGRAKATFVGYDQKWSRTTSSGPSPTNWGQQDFQETWSAMSYPVYSYVAAEGGVQQHREPKAHIWPLFKAGQEVDILLSSSGHPRLAGFHPLYAMDLSVLAVGLCFVLIPFLIGRTVIQSLESRAGTEIASHIKSALEQLLSARVGPMSVATLMIGLGAFVVLIALVGIIQEAMPYLRQLGLGTGSGLITALEQKRYDDAREMIVKRKGVNRVNDYNQSALLLALQAGRSDLARMLIEAGADVNVKSKMLMTPLRVSAQAGDLEMVKLLLAKGASPDTPEDETPPIAYALLKGQDK